MEIVLVRHGEPEWVRNELNVVDPPLTDRGHMQAARMGEVLGRERFDIVVASEVMAIFCLATSLKDLKERLGNIVFGYTRDGKPLRVMHLAEILAAGKAAGAMAETAEGHYLAAGLARFRAALD